MVNDFINLTQGQLLVKYWYIWLAIVLIFMANVLYNKYEHKIRKSVYVRPRTAGGELRVTTTNTVGTYRDMRASEYIRPQTDGEIRITEKTKEDKYKPIRASEYVCKHCKR